MHYNVYLKKKTSIIFVTCKNIFNNRKNKTKDHCSKVSSILSITKKLTDVQRLK